ncbi:MAG: ECF transporter S component [Candidatus Bathyarchaeales archaeon]
MEKDETAKIVFLSILTAICLALQLSPRPPNVEFTSLFTFIVGFIYGSFAGMLFGGFVMFVNGFFSPWGFAGLNMPFQMIGMALIGLAGGVYQKFSKGYTSISFCFEAAVLGAFFTTLYDLITNLGVAFQFALTGTPPDLAVLTALAYGTPFSLIHVASNMAVFGVAFLPLIKAVNNVMVAKKLG